MAKTQPKPKVTIASIVYELIKAGKKDDAIIIAIKKKFPESKINESHMNWYRRELELKSNPKAKAKVVKTEKKDKVKKEDEEADEDEELEDDEVDDEEEEDEEEKE
jgi:hypothetical protein